MGFSGGGSNILKPHTHDGSIAQDGGALNMDGITQGSLTAGDVVYSDGSNLQRLAIGSASDQMRVNAGATAPEWFTPAAAGGVELLDFTQITGAAGTLQTGTFTAKDSLYFQIYAANTTNTNQALFFNADRGTNYSSRYSGNLGAFATLTGRQDIPYLVATATGGYWNLCQGWVSNVQDEEKNVIMQCCAATGGTGSASVPDYELTLGKWANTTDQITVMSVTDANSTQKNMEVGSYIAVFGMN